MFVNPNRKMPNNVKAKFFRLDLFTKDERKKYRYDYK